ncbi:hypothetical protein CISIN_1g0389791mg, partial [Citrus sinensis]
SAAGVQLHEQNNH